jgi:hypothetical protein
VNVSTSYDSSDKGSCRIADPCSVVSSSVTASSIRSLSTSSLKRMAIGVSPGRITDPLPGDVSSTLSDSGAMISASPHPIASTSSSALIAPPARRSR